MASDVLHNPESDTWAKDVQVFMFQEVQFVFTWGHILIISEGSKCAHVSMMRCSFHKYYYSSIAYYLTVLTVLLKVFYLDINLQVFVHKTIAARILS